MQGGGVDDAFHRALAEVPLLSRLGGPMIGVVAAAGELVTVRGGEWLFRQGDDGDVLYVVVTGRLEVVVTDGSREAVLRTLTFGDAVGELAVVCAAPRSASVRAVRDSTLLGLSQAAVAELCRSDPSFALALLASVGEKLRTRTDPAPVRVRRCQVLALMPLDDAAPLEDLGPALVWAIEPFGSVEHIRSDAARSEESTWAQRLDTHERTHDYVVLDGSRGEEADAWNRFCTRQADRVLAVAGRPPSGSHPRHDRWDLVVTGTACERRSTRRWIDLVDPRGHHQVRQHAAEADIDRLARRITGNAVGLVLSGGGARGLAHVGVLDVLLDAGVSIDRVGGTSMGAFVAALFAMGHSPAAINRLCRAELVERRPFGDYTWPKVALIRARRAQAMLTRLFGEARLEDLLTDCFSVSADLTTAEVVVHRRGGLVEAVGASMSLPGLAPPVPVAGRLLVDGGVLNNLPADVMAMSGEGPVIAVDVLSRTPVGRYDRMPSIVETLARASVIGSRYQLPTRLAVADAVIAPEVSDIGLLDFSRIDEIIDAGRRAALRAVDDGAVSFPVS